MVFSTCEAIENRNISVAAFVEKYSDKASGILLLVIPFVFNCGIFIINVMVYFYVRNHVNREMQSNVNRCFDLMDSVLVNLIPNDVQRLFSKTPSTEASQGKHPPSQ
ncbi:hypothetical protein Y032_0003g1686 [Ancylostoma ceylanicum]|uniref:Uncharacterized protein n=1 Tax=Ancylostoma ceylanicum TaxID=53326 RepID=A0A016VZ71_9BILA|nr:hypothetical protein Y032_0003g1686 [Ancylostoma ceylanicum]